MNYISRPIANFLQDRWYQSDREAIGRFFDRSFSRSGGAESVTDPNDRDRGCDRCGSNGEANGDPYRL